MVWMVINKMYYISGGLSMKRCFYFCCSIISGFFRFKYSNRQHLIDWKLFNNYFRSYLTSECSESSTTPILKEKNHAGVLCGYGTSPVMIMGIIFAILFLTLISLIFVRIANKIIIWTLLSSDGSMNESLEKKKKLMRVWWE